MNVGVESANGVDAGPGPGVEGKAGLDPQTVGGAAYGAGPPAICDLVMKGGITSGVIYPRVVCELAKRYRFKSIGGTSAGAIAAAVTVAAECGRRNGKADAYDALGKLPGWLGENGHLLAMFRPVPSTRPVFDAIMGALDAKGGGVRKLLSALFSACRSFPLWAALGVAPGLVVLALVLTEAVRWPLLVAGVSGGMLLAVLGFLIFPFVVLMRRFVWAVPANFYGLSSGFDPASGTDAPLTNWLSHLINDLAGKPQSAPLTFGDLWKAAQPGADLSVLRNDPKLRSIDLRVVTSCLTHGKPYGLPFDTKIFSFDPEAWRKLFPTNVVDWMVAHERPFEPGVDPEGGVAAKGGKPKLCRLPLPEHLPVVVAARISLSFPVLISALPLYAVDFTREYNKGNSHSRPKGAPREAEVCWFSDGGISSNFPIHFFDAPFPRWPTFGIDLVPFPYDHTPKSEAEIGPFEPFAVSLPKSNNEGWEDTWNRFGNGDDPLKRLTGFLGAILNTMQNWHDTTQGKLPGYRRRIVHISVAPWEGGYNLDMSGAVIQHLGDRGRRAGAELAALDAAWWDEHRWTRYRSAMAVLETFLGQMPTGYRDAYSSPPLCDLIARSPDSPPPAYPWRDADQAVFGVKMTDALITLVQTWGPPGQSFGPKAPRPLPELQIGPKV